jgi:hypothetical protein
VLLVAVGVGLLAVDDHDPDHGVPPFVSGTEAA